MKWRSALVWVAAIDAGLFAAIGIHDVDREAIAFAVLYIAGLALLQLGRRGFDEDAHRRLRSGDRVDREPRPVLAHLHHRQARRQRPGARRWPPRAESEFGARNLHLLLRHPRPSPGRDAGNAYRSLAPAIRSSAVTATPAP